jgi:hypothetical protein
MQLYATWGLSLIGAHALTGMQTSHESVSGAASCTTVTRLPLHRCTAAPDRFKRVHVMDFHCVRKLFLAPLVLARPPSVLESWSRLFIAFLYVVCQPSLVCS